MSSDDNDLGLDDDNFDSFEKKKMTVGDMWREKPLFKVGVIVAAAIIVFGIIVLFGGSSEPPVDPSSLQTGSEVSAPPATDGASDAYNDAIREQNEAIREEAEAQGGSALPTPIDPPVGRVTQDDSTLEQDDPLQRWRELQEERLARELNDTSNANVEVQQAPENRNEQIQQMSAAMAQQMQSILEKKSSVKVGYKSVTDPSFLDDLNKEAEEEAAAQAAKNSEVKVEEIIMPAGEIAYAQLITEANSDVEGPVLAQIAGGPLNGARILGDFQLEEDKEILVLNFDTIVLEGISYDIEAVAIDPDTTLPGMATDVDHHYLKRVVLPMAAAFVEGMASAISESGTTTVTIDSGAAVEEEADKDSEQEVASGIEEAGQKLSEIMDEEAEKIEVTVRIDAGTPMGVLFLEPVIKREPQQNVNPAALSTRAVASEGTTAR